jgi:protein-S-isoprenylcysteine O-methyltransferase Ste14
MQSMFEDMFPLLQIFLLIFTTLLFHIGITNPNISSTNDYTPNEGAGLTFTVFLGPKLGKILIWISTLYQVVYLYLQVFSPASISTFFSQTSMSINPLALTLTSILGYIFMIVGGLGRIWCYRTLGKFFTFNLTIRNSHKLIKSGPYAYVRHPSYTFASILTLGMFLVHQRMVNFFPNNRWVQVQFGPLGFLACCTIVTLLFYRRIPREEEELSKTFGKEWSEYASKTKRFIPKII